MKDKATQKLILDLSQKIVNAQASLLVLDAIKWDESIEKDFFKKKCKELPPVNENYYKNRPLRFDPDEKIEEFYKIEHEVTRQLGMYSAISLLMRERCQEYRDVVSLLKSRGTPEFSEISKKLYGSSRDAFYINAPTLEDLCTTVTKVLSKIDPQEENGKSKKIYTADQAVDILKSRLEKYFGKETQIHAVTSDYIVADAAAGADTITLRSDLKFSEQNIKLYEVHEGWVHLGTTFNGSSQPFCTFLSKGPPSTLVIQEGLAMLVEIFTFSSYPNRVRRLVSRIMAIEKAEKGANFLNIFNFFRDQGIGDVESYQNTVRVFRGSQPSMGPFTKDLAYTKGFVLIFNYIRLAVQEGHLSYIPLLFTGKINLPNIRLLHELLEEGILEQPRYIPPLFRDTSALSAWSSFSIFIDQLDVKKLDQAYQNIF